MTHLQKGIPISPLMQGCADDKTVANRMSIIGQIINETLVISKLS